MAKYTVLFTLTATGYTDVEAESEDDAYELVEGDDFDYYTALENASSVDVQCDDARPAKK
jgi:hypothetical protein